jgi:hypothetical protein
VSGDIITCERKIVEYICMSIKMLNPILDRLVYISVGGI